ncbi:MAG: hypothetical protein PVSMB8_16170 [Vulcanimicrobiaceae bacterium]
MKKRCLATYTPCVLRKQPGFAALAALTLGLGIGGATTIFSVILNVLLDPYPYAHVDRKVTIERLQPTTFPIWLDGTMTYLESRVRVK